MTYVTEQTPAQLRAHMKRLKAMSGWHEPLADRLYAEIVTMDAEIDRLRTQNQAQAQVLALKAMERATQTNDAQVQAAASQQCRAALAQAEDETFGLSMSMFANQRDYQDEKNRRLRARLDLQEGGV